ncbi:MAG: hypothetical protein ACHQHN_02770 [Sphingobacteriales bacterium]
MENQLPDYSNVIQIDDADSSRKFMAGVFAWMFVALGISAALAFAFANYQPLKDLLIDPVTQQSTGLAFIIMLSPLAFVLTMSLV